ncbi:MAG: GTPase HflX, partial [Myxococcota bacterium]
CDTIEALGANDTPTITVINKIDAVDSKLWGALRERYEAMLISANTGEGLKELLVQVERHLFREQAQGAVQ